MHKVIQELVSHIVCKSGKHAIDSWFNARNEQVEADKRVQWCGERLDALLLNTAELTAAQLVFVGAHKDCDFEKFTHCWGSCIGYVAGFTYGVTESLFGRPVDFSIFLADVESNCELQTAINDLVRPIFDDMKRGKVSSNYQLG